jgi:hypothetical protein
MTGKGLFIYSSGDNYEGEFYRNCRHGNGTQTLEIGKMIKKTEKGQQLWLMVMFWMLVGQTDFYMDLEFLELQMGMSTLEIGLMVMLLMVVCQMNLDMDLEFIDMQMGMSTWEIGKKTKWMENEL